ncbi:hypothetical protein DPSP01_005095 [Paraphaeosphaeria sporulosa]|uniref:Pal1-domain-containing protein n=1 Tax=Paraphaeosphaeria sporulosa TaxID=1460663 RepID=A0A177C1W1_9PLEO|nr:uncharacterized protein CC84DRAFT_1101103 [Paraphaeosphaeria sporulosa]OAG00832.1 hypothetical protein CC84DRAFT_1101103 [Paraphaeosphaeria sporulosa]
MSSSRPHHGVHGPSKHGRLHRRGHSASSVTSPLSPGQFTFSRSETPVTYEEPWTDIAQPMPAATSHSHKIKPYLRKLSSKDNDDLDLSRPAAENERLAGLGIVDYGGYTRTVGDVNFASVKSRNHARSTSNTSQFSTSSSLQRPMPSIRQSPRPYTPPISKSTPASTLLNADHEPADNIMTDDEFRMRQAAYDPTRKSGSLSSSTPGQAAPALRIHTTGSSSFLAGSYSQSTVSLTSPIAQSRSRGDTVKSMDTTSPSSRTSFDKAFGFIRPGRDSPIDAQSRAASIRAARQAFEEKEAAKERKYDRDVHKKVERETKKQYKRDEYERRKSESNDKKRSRSVSDATSYERASRPSVGARQYSDHREAHTSTLPNLVPLADPEKSGYAPTPKVTKSRQAKGRWLRFLIWFKTRFLRMGTKLHVQP